MNKIWLLAATTYRRQIRSGAFLVLTFALPVLMVIAGAIPILTSRGDDATGMIGYVATGAATDVTQVSGDGESFDVRRYESADAARSALEAGQIAGYLLLENGNETAVYTTSGDISNTQQAAVTALMRRLALREQPDWARERIADPVKVTYAALDTTMTLTEGTALTLRAILPVALGVLFGLAIFLTSSQMGTAVIREKEQRAMEMVITSVEPRQLVAGKVLGITLLSATQFAIWLAAGVLALALLLGDQLALSDLAIFGQPLLWAALLCIPGYFLYAVLAAGLGILGGDSQQARQLTALLGIAALAPLWFTGVLIAPGSETLATALTLFPLTAPVAALVRLSLNTPPLWQMLTAVALIVISLIAALWGVSRVFRAAMLMYGQRLRPQQVWQALRG